LGFPPHVASYGLSARRQHAVFGGKEKDQQKHQGLQDDDHPARRAIQKIADVCAQKARSCADADRNGEQAGKPIRKWK